MEGAQMCRQVGDRLKVQAHDKDKHVYANDAHGEAVEHALETRP